MIPHKNYQLSELPIEMHKFKGLELMSLENEVDEILTNNFKDAVPYNPSLIGHIKHEYELSKCKYDIEKLLLPWANKFKSKNKNIPEDTKFYLKTLWVNYQQKYEYNPLHNHNGALSFVIWLKIPYNQIEEKLVFNHVLDGHKQNGTFVFFNAMPDTFGISTTQVYLDKEHERMMCMFPALMYHGVNPFYTSDEFRISVSGNFHIVGED
jgi:hypothetical protein